MSHIDHDDESGIQKEKGPRESQAGRPLIKLLMFCFRSIDIYRNHRSLQRTNKTIKDMDYIPRLDARLCAVVIFHTKDLDAITTS